MCARAPRVRGEEDGAGQEAEEEEPCVSACVRACDESPQLLHSASRAHALDLLTHGLEEQERGPDSGSESA